MKEKITFIACPRDESGEFFVGHLRIYISRIHKTVHMEVCELVFSSECLCLMLLCLHDPPENHKTHKILLACLWRAKIFQNFPLIHI